MKKVITEVKKLINEESTTIDYKRVYIRKSNGKYRPLGVPTLEGRIYLHMGNQLVVGYRLGVIEENQHAYLPKRGVFTAGQEVFPKLNNKGNIYEFDLSGFFDEVDLEYNKDRLISIGVPPVLSEYLTALNRSIVKFTKEDLINEDSQRKILYNPDKSVNPNLPSSLIKELKENPSKSRLEELNRMGYQNYRTKGVPQGASTSCALSTLNLNKLFQELSELIMYADEGICFPEGPETPDCSHKEAGVIQSIEKSSGAKVNNKGQKSLKFLGIEYIPANIRPLDESEAKDYPRLRAASLKGSILEFDVNLQFLSFLTKEMEKLLSGCEKELKEAIKDYNPHDPYSYGLGIDGKTNVWYNSLKSGGMANKFEDTQTSTLSKFINNTTVGNGISHEGEVFKELSVNSRLHQLFLSPLGPTIVAMMNNNTLDLSDQDLGSNKLTFRKGSGIHIGGAQYHLNMILDNSSLFSIYHQNIDILSAERARRIALGTLKTKLVDEIEYEIKYTKDLAEQVEGSVCLLDESSKDILRLTKWETLKDIVLGSLFKGVDPRVEESLTQKLTELRKDANQWKEYLLLRNNLKKIISRYPLTLHNASTFASNDLLEGFSNNNSDVNNGQIHSNTRRSTCTSFIEGSRKLNKKYPSKSNKIKSKKRKQNPTQTK